MHRLFQFAQQKKNHLFLCLILSSCPILVRVVWTMLSLAADGDKTFIFHTHRPPPQSKMFTTRRPARTTWTAKWGGFKLTNQAKQNEINQKKQFKKCKHRWGKNDVIGARVFFIYCQESFWPWFLSVFSSSLACRAAADHFSIPARGWWNRKGLANIMDLLRNFLVIVFTRASVTLRGRARFRWYRFEPAVAYHRSCMAPRESSTLGTKYLFEWIKKLHDNRLVKCILHWNPGTGRLGRSFFMPPSGVQGP